MAQFSEIEIQVLIKRIQQGESDLFGRIFDIFSDRVFRFLYFRLNNEEQAKDLVSEVFLGAFQNLKGYQPRNNTKFSTWLFSIAHKKLVSFYRKDKTEKSSRSKLTDDLSAELENTKLEYEEVVEEIKKLPENLQEIIILRLVEELNYSEISQITGKTEGNIRVLIHRAVKQLRKLLDE